PRSPQEVASLPTVQVPVFELSKSHFAADRQGMIRRPTLAAALTLTLLLLASLASLPTLAGARPHAKATHALKRHERVVKRHEHASARHGHAVTPASGVSHPAKIPSHRTHSFRGRHRAASGLATHGVAASGGGAVIAAVLATACQNTELIP